MIRQMVALIDEEDWQEIEVIGWLYQFYISEKKDQAAAESPGTGPSTPPPRQAGT